MKTHFVSRQQLDDKLDWIKAAPGNCGAIDTLCVRPAEGERRFVDSLRVTPEEGVVGDRWIWKTWMHLEDGSPDPRLQVCMLNKRVLDCVRIDPAMMHPGDNIIAEMDFSEANLPAGQRLKIGSAVLEISDVFNNACPKWLRRFGGESVAWINQPDYKPLRLRGALAKVAHAGEIKITDTIHKLPD